MEDVCLLANMDSRAPRANRGAGVERQVCYRPGCGVGRRPDAAGLTGTTCAALLDRAVAWYAARQITVHRVMSDNGSGYVSRPFRAACQAHALRPWLRYYNHDRPHASLHYERVLRDEQRV